eukprot:3935744-Rhodomonas_salina.1
MEQRKGSPPAAADPPSGYPPTSYPIPPTPYLLPRSPLRTSPSIVLRDARYGGSVWDGMSGTEVGYGGGDM